MEYKRTSRCFTLIEVVVGIFLLLLASGVVGLKMYHAVQRKQFQSELERLQARLAVCQKLAIATQTDWNGRLKKRGKEWTFESSCEEGRMKKLPLLQLHCDIYLDGKKANEIAFDFFSTGQVLPHGTLRFVHKEERAEWRIDAIFQREEGSKLGPLHPSES